MKDNEKKLFSVPEVDIFLTTGVNPIDNLSGNEENGEIPPEPNGGNN